MLVRGHRMAAVVHLLAKRDAADRDVANRDAANMKSQKAYHNMLVRGL